MGQPCLKRMSINPIFAENCAFIKHAHKLVVHGVYDWKKPVKEEVFDEVKRFCRENHIVFTIREFMPQNLSEDREEIEKLPAFQIYLESEYEKTSYPNDAVKSIIEILTALDTKPPKLFSWSFKMPSLKRRSIVSSVAPESM